MLGLQKAPLALAGLPSKSTPHLQIQTVTGNLLLGSAGMRQQRSQELLVCRQTFCI